MLTWPLALGVLLALSPLAAAAEVEFRLPVALTDDGDPFANRDDILPELATDGAGNWVAVWQRSEVTQTVFTARSTDGAATWSAPVPIAPAAGGQDPDIATDGTVWIVVWDGGPGPDVDVFSSRSLDGGVSWSTPVVLNANSTGDDARGDERPEIVTRGGTWLVTWTTSANASDGAPTGTDRDLLFVRSTDGGVSWSAPAPLNGDATSDAADAIDWEAQLAGDGAGTWIATWIRANDDDAPVRVARSLDDGVTWTAPAQFSPSPLTDGTRSGRVAIAADGNDTFTAVWGAWRGTPTLVESDVLFVRSTNDGATWSAPARLSSAADEPGEDFDPDIATDGTTWLAVWPSTTTLGKTLDVDFDILVSWSSDGLTWSPPEPLDRNATGDSRVGLVFQDYWARVVAGGDGSFAAIWSQEHFRSFSDPRPIDLRVARGPLPQCPPSPQSGCLVADKASLRVKEVVAGKESLKATLSRFTGGLSPADLGDPVEGDSIYHLCFYDDAATLVGGMVVARGGGLCGKNFKPCWQALSATDLSYGDAFGWAGGLKRLKARTGTVDQAKVVVKGVNKTGQFPAGMTAALAGSTAATLQIVVDDGACLEASLTTVTLADGSIFSAVR
jgi:hypothetical protein